ncbi:MAG: transposase [Balneolaceae bacterium]|nr:transposase [Balneolaceae bacterium]
MIKKGKRRPSVEFGKNLAVTSDSCHLIVDWELAEGRPDSELIEEVAERLDQKYHLQSLSVDKGFSSRSVKANLEAFIPEVIMPKKGRRTKAERAAETAPAFRRLKNAHNAVESNINELEHRGLDRCPNRTRAGFDRYVGLAITAYNLHKIGRELRDRRRQARAA